MFLELALSLVMTAQPAQAAEEPAVKESLSQLIRSNAGHYWSWVAKDSLKPYSKYEGIVAGDPHMGNFSVIPVETANGKRALRFVNIDFDDAGVGPLALDFARFVITVKTVSKDIKIKDLVQAYSEGLQGKRVPAPARVQETLSMSIPQYDELDARYVDKKTSHGKFKMVPGEIEKYDAKYSMSDITKLFPNEKVLDVASRPMDRGGSLGALRIWVLTESADQVQHINEIKGYQLTSMAKFQPQPEPLTLIKHVQATYWPGLNPATYKLTSLAGDLVWVRGKKVPLIDIPYKQKSVTDELFVAGLAVYDANLLGIIHGAQSKAYASEVTKDADAFREAVKQLSREYIDYADKTLR